MLGILLGERCGVCGRAGRGLCASCAGELEGAPDLEPPAGLDRCWALLTYDGAARDLVAALKYRNHRDAVPVLAAALAVLAAPLARARPATVVTWAPTTESRRRRRGYDQAEVLARATAAELALVTTRLLVRLPGPPQTGRNRAGRRGGPAFTSEPSPRSVLVVDDVWTTGSTLAAAGRALRAAGAAEVSGLVLAARP